MMKYTTGWESNEKKHLFLEKVWEQISQAFPIWWVLLTFLMLLEIWWENPCIFHAIKYTIGWESNGKKHPHYGKSMSTNLPVSSHTMGFVAFSCSVGNWWGNPCISQMMKYAIGWESNEKKSSTLWENNNINFLDFPHTMGFVAFSCNLGNWWRDPCISHMMKYTIGWESNGKKAPIP